MATEQELKEINPSHKEFQRVLFKELQKWNGNMNEHSSVDHFNMDGWAIIKSFIKEDDIKNFTDICLPKSSDIEKDFGTSKNKDIVALEKGLKVYTNNYSIIKECQK